MIVFGEEGNRLVFTGTSVYRALVPTERMRAAGVKEELLKPIPKGYMGQEKVRLSPLLDSSIDIGLGTAYNSDAHHGRRSLQRRSLHHRL